MKKFSGARARNLALAVILAGALSGCQGWHQVAKPTPGGNLEGNPEEVRVTRTAGCGPTPSRSCIESRGTITLFNPRVQGDSLIGYYDRANLERVSIAVSDITNVESRKVDKLRTTGAVLGGAVVAYFVVAALVVIAWLAAIN